MNTVSISAAGLREWDELVGRQRGIVSRAQAMNLGLDEDTIRNLQRSGRWRPVHRGVYTTVAGELSRDAVLWAAVLRAGPGAVLSHQSAAELLGFGGRPGALHISVPLGRHPAPIRGVVVHRSVRVAAAAHPVQLPPRTRVEETAIDLAQAAGSLDDAGAWLCAAVGRRLTTAALLRSALDARPKVRWRHDLEMLLADAGSGVHSLLEYRYVRDVERPHGLPAAVRQERTGTASRARYLDNYYEAAKLAVELDGVAHLIEQRQADIRRDNEHAAAGIVTLRYTWADVAGQPCGVARQIADVMARRGAPVGVRGCGPSCTAVPRGPPGRARVRASSGPSTPSGSRDPV